MAQRRQCVHAASSSRIPAPGQALTTFHSSNVLLAGSPWLPSTVWQLAQAFKAAG